MTGAPNKGIFGRAIDVHGHLVPEQLLAENNGPREKIGVSVERSPEGGTFLVHGGHKLGPIHPGMASGSKRLEWMDSHGIARQWISPWMDLFTWTDFDTQDARAWHELVNAAISEVAEASNARLRPLVSVYLDDPEQAAAQALEDVTGRGNAAGLLLNTHPSECESLAAESMWPFWKAVEKMGVPVMLHPPTNGPSCEITSKLLQNVTGRLIDTTSVATDMMLSGFFSRFPKIKIILAHGGGMLPYQCFRMDGLNRAALAPASLGGKLFTDEIRNFFYDTVTLDPISLELLVKRVGVEKVLLGSDAPFPIGDPDPLGRVLASALSEAEKEEICCNNASHLEVSKGER